MRNDSGDLPPAITALERHRLLPKLRVLPLIGHSVSIVATAFAAAYIKNNLSLATLVFALSVGAALRRSG